MTTIQINLGADAGKFNPGIASSTVLGLATVGKKTGALVMLADGHLMVIGDQPVVVDQKLLRAELLRVSRETVTASPQEMEARNRRNKCYPENITQTEMADRLGVGYSTFMGWYRRDNTVPDEIVQKVANLLTSAQIVK